MKKKKMVTWVCECEYREEEFSCKLITKDVGEPTACPFNLNDGKWIKIKQGDRKRKGNEPTINTEGMGKMKAPQEIDLKEDGIFILHKRILSSTDLINNISVIKAPRGGLVAVTRHYNDNWFLYVRKEMEK